MLDAFPNALHIVDPVMGDHGRLYSAITPAHVDAMAKLCCRADVILPNVTEAALLTGLPYRETADPGYYRQLLAGMEKYGAKMKMWGRMPDALSGAMGNQMYIANLETEEELNQFFADLLA